MQNASDAAEPLKQRVTITISPDVFQLGQVLSQQERRSFSNLVEALIDREAKRQNPKPEEKPA
jgi:predicted CopG family antitoxin